MIQAKWVKEVLLVVRSSCHTSTNTKEGPEGVVTGRNCPSSTAAILIDAGQRLYQQLQVDKSKGVITYFCHGAEQGMSFSNAFWVKFVRDRKPDVLEQ